MPLFCVTVAYPELNVIQGDSPVLLPRQVCNRPGAQKPTIRFFSERVRTPPNIPSWGNIMAEGRSLFLLANYLIFFPGIFLSLAVLSVNLLGDGLRDALDPRLARNM